jgi:hypothetical protein
LCGSEKIKKNEHENQFHFIFNFIFQFRTDLTERGLENREKEKTVKRESIVVYEGRGEKKRGEEKIDKNVINFYAKF